MTVEELNAALVEEFKRLGGREPIEEAIKQFTGGSPSIKSLDPSQYPAVLAAVKAK